MTDDAGTPRAVIERACPAVHVRTVERIGEGWDHVAFLVNDELVFRLPSADAETNADAVAAEVRLLRAVAGRLPVATPEPVHVASDGTFFGYRYLPGESIEQLLDDGRWRPETDGSLTELVVDVIVAIEDLIRPEVASAMGIRRADGRRYAQEEQWALDSGHITPAMRAVHDDVVRKLPVQWAAAMRRPVS
ncbi:MAG TPA: phosphotransferase, partial [Acidimicrobiales bacterium]|nr:phosphotransferase [Acidimicrobiales bacterium]